MKRANVLPLYKDGDPTSFNNYRPVSLLSVLSKVLERVMYARCIKFIEKHNILYDRQFGFRQNHSTTHALLLVMDKLDKIEGAPKVPLCPKYGAIPTIISGVTAFCKKWHTPFFLDRPPSWKCYFDQTGFWTCPSPEWKKAGMWILEQFMLFFFSYRGHSTSWHIRAREEVKGQMEL